MESEPKAETEIPLHNETPPKNADSNPDPAATAAVSNGDFAINDSSAIGSDTATARPALTKSVSWSAKLVNESPRPPSPNYASRTTPDGSNPYLRPALGDVANSFSFKESMFTVKDVLGRWGRKVAEASKKAEDLAGNTWQHLKTSPSFADAAMGRIAQGTKVLAEGGHEKVFQQTFETVPEEQLQNSFACYLSTSAGPVMGTLYVSTAKLAFCSDSPLSYKSANQTEWSYYKVVIPLDQLKAVNPSASRSNPSEKYIQVISVDNNHEFWFMGFLNYNGALLCLEHALQSSSSSVQSP